MRRYRRSAIKLKLKKQTVQTILAFLFFGLALIASFSFSRKGFLLAGLYFKGQEWFGVSGYFFVPFLLLSAGLIFSRLKWSVAKLNVFVGLIICWLGVLGMAKSGGAGGILWESVESVFPVPLGIFLLFLLTAGLGIVVMLNKSLAEIAEWFAEITTKAKQNFNRLFIDGFRKKTPRPVFVQDKQSLEHSKLKIIDGSNVPKPQITLNTPGASSEAYGAAQSPKLTDPTITGEVVANSPDSIPLWQFPPLSLLEDPSSDKADRGDVRFNADIIEKTLESFGITARVVEVNPGPAVTQYALEIAVGTKLSKITALQNDLALALAAPTGQIRIEAPIPGRSLVGVEIPNRSLEFVTIKQILASPKMQEVKSKLAVALGLDVSNNAVVADLAKMPHILIAGATGSGKSVCINAFLTSLLFRSSPSEVKLILVDPKRVELTPYNGIPHLLTPVIVELEQILSALKWALKEMDRRYKAFAEAGARNIDSYNELAGFQMLPYIVILVDELADVIMFAPVEVEDAICRLAQMARATGIHLVVSTQRPSVDVITGLIKANIPARIAFNVTSMIDSRVIIDTPGAEKLLGRGDMLYIPPDQSKPHRIQGAFVSDNEVKKLVNFLKSAGPPVQYTEEVTNIQTNLKRNGFWGSVGAESGDDAKDALFDDAIRVITSYDKASASLLQRRLSIGYARAARILDQLEEAGVVGPGEGAKPRDVLVKNPNFALKTAEPA